MFMHCKGRKVVFNSVLKLCSYTMTFSNVGDYLNILYWSLKNYFDSVCIPKYVSLLFCCNLFIPKYLSGGIVGVRREYHILLKYVCLFLTPSWVKHFLFSLSAWFTFHLFCKSQCSVSVSYKVSNIHKHVLKNNMLFTKFWQHQQLRYTVFSITLFSFFFSFLTYILPVLYRKKKKNPITQAGAQGF